MQYWKIRFQSTFPRGERLFMARKACKLKPFQSTFPRGERRMGETSLNYVLYFNPRSRVGNDLILPDQDISIALFQSTFPRGERHQLISSWRVKIRFQSTFPRGERQIAELTEEKARLDFNPRSRVGND